uniref:Laminin G domain-containing protein n=1 Tax=Oncorhynchus tshawytscha TaxID=74940 RepID=A0A8C8CT71_ONCTS
QNLTVPTQLYLPSLSLSLSLSSFYGDGYVQLKTVESSNRNSLRVRFRTSSPHGLLFLAAGHTDYLLVELNAGRLQVKLELGSGERLLRSESSTQLNDLAWHTAEILHDRHNVTLTMDQYSHTSLRMPGHWSQKQDLTIQDGLYVGGSGGLDKLYLPNDLTGFRGCVEQAVFNENNMLSSLRPYAGFKSVYEVSLGCSPQFFAGEEDPVSFFSSRAYVSLPPWNVSHNQQEALFECVVHTSAKEGIVLYNSARQGDFVAVEIQEGLLVAIVGKGGTKTELKSLTFVNDRNWHSVKIFFTPKTLQLTVDKETVKTSISSRTKGLQLRGSLFVGGIDDSTRSEVRKMGLVSVLGNRVRGGSFKGCLKDMKVNGVMMGLPNAVVTKDISVGCEPEKEPEPSTTMGPTTIPTVPNSRFDPTSVTPTPKFPMFTLARGLVKKYGANFVLLRNLVVSEGGRGSLESKHIKVLLDFKKLGVRQSQIMFRIQEQPVHGQIRLDVDQDQEENIFSMLDLWHGRVMYIHGGSEDPEDFFTFSIFSSSRKEVPTYLQGTRRYRYNITVTPTNDAPELSLPQGNLFVLLENSRKLLTKEVLKATDIDSNHTDLVFSILGNLNPDAGYLEVGDNPDTAVTTFSHSDLEEGKVNYVHTGVRNSRIVLRVSDGDKVSNTVVLRIMAIGLEYKIANNTGLEIIQGEVAVISNKQLAIQTNAVNQVVDIRYDVVKPPRYGELQRLHSSGEWKPTGSFSQRLLEKERLRYLSTFQEIQTATATDDFKCKVTVAGRVDTELVFPVTVKWVHYNLVRNVMADINKVRKVTLDSHYLYATVDIVTLSEDDLHFRVLSSPKKGQLLLVNELLKKNSTFSQRNVTDLKVLYELVDRPYEDTSDTFKFQVFSKHAQSQSYDFQISIKADVNSVFIRNYKLSIMEGESKLITKDELFAETLSTKELYYTVTSSPKHGKLARINLSNSNGSYNNILTFSNQDLLEERVMYIHDDTETTQDQFTFIASTSQESKSSVTDEEVGSKEGTFNISIQLVNDEKPVRVVDKVFHVVRDGQRLLTLDDLCYHDADSDFSDGQLVYTRRGIPMGDLVLVNDTSHRLFQFTQKELEEKRVLFLHRGVNSGRFVLFVSDGKHLVSTLLDVSAHDPFLSLGNNTGLLVQKGKEVTVTTGNFSVLTNLNVRDDSEVTYKVSEPPKNGWLYRHGNISVEFTQHDLKKGLVSYRHDDTKNLADWFSVTVKVKGHVLNARINVKAYLESHQRPPILQHNNTLLVEESKPVEQELIYYIHDSSETLEDNFTVVANDTGLRKQSSPCTVYIQVTAVNDQHPVITANRVLRVWVGSVTEIHSDDLDAQDEDTPPEELQVIVTPPSNGHLVLKSALARPLLNFTLQHIHLGQLLFVHSGAMSGGFNFQVNDGVNFAPRQIFSITASALVLSLEINRPLKVFPGCNVKNVEKGLNISRMHCNYGSFGPTYRLFSRCILGAVVTEGDHIVIDKSKLDASNLMSKLPTPQRSSHEIWFQVKSLPQHGVIVVGERNLTVEKPNFSQYILNKYGITYRHDDSETLHDHFVFDTWLNPKGKPAQLIFFFPNQVLEEWFNITVIPVNDQPPVLKTKAPSLSVVQGDTVALGPENLTVEDLDNPSEDIQYTVVSKPNNGYLALGGSLNESVVSFTQAQINSGMVYFVHDGSRASGVFYFSVSDGHHKPVYKLFNLEVTEITISLVNNTGLALEQGQTSVVLTQESLVAETNGKNTTVHYRITAAPRYGKILRLDDQEVNQFEQEDLRTGSLFYHMTALTSGQDSFEFTAFTSEANLTNQVVNITVKPLVRFGEGVRISNGIVVKLNTGFLNATELASLSVSDPFFEVVSHPKYGKLVRGKPKAGKNTEPLGSFSFQDVKQERLSFELNANMTGVQELNDSLVFILKAENVPPARGEFRFTIVPYDPSLVLTTKSPILTTSSPFSQPLNQTTVFGVGTALPSLSTSLLSTQRPSKTHQKFKGRNRWGNTNRNDSAGTDTTLGKPTLSKGDDNEISFVNTPVRVESYPQKSSNLILVILPLLAMLLLVIILVVLVFLLRRNRKRKQKPVTSKPPASPSPSTPPAYNGQSQRSVAVPTVTVTPLSPSSPALDRLLPSANQGLVSNSTSLLLCSWNGVDPESSAQLIRTTPPTLQQNQYWV